MADAIKIRDLEERKAHRKAERERAAAHAQAESFKDKTFEALSKSEKDLLLKAVAIRLGLIKPSDDTPSGSRS